MNLPFKPTILLDPSKVDQLNDGEIALDVTNKKILFKINGNVGEYGSNISETKIEEIINNNTTINNLTNTITEIQQNSIPTDGIPGQVLSVLSNGNLVWTDTSHLRGPQGPQGETGPQGLQGPQGATGPQGPKGADAVVASGTNLMDWGWIKFSNGIILQWGWYTLGTDIPSYVCVFPVAMSDTFSCTYSVGDSDIPLTNPTISGVTGASIRLNSGGGGVGTIYWMVIGR